MRFSSDLKKCSLLSTKYTRKPQFPAAFLFFSYNLADSFERFASGTFKIVIACSADK